MAWGNRGKDKATTGVKAGGVSFDPPADVDGAPRTDDVPHDVIDAEDETVPADDSTVSLSKDEDAVVQDEAVPAFAPTTSRFGRRSGPKEPKVAKVKAPKQPKVAKVKKSSKLEDRAVEDYPMPVMMVIEFYEGLTKEREAEQLGRAMIEKNFDAPNASYVYTQKWRNGIAVEVQEGGGQAYLPEILQKLDEDPEAIIAVPMSNRIAQVRLDAETGRLEMLLLLNNQEPPPESFVPLPSRAMKPFDRRGSRLFIAGIALLASTVIASVFSVGAFFIDTEAWALPYVQQTEVKAVPMSQLADMKIAAAKGDCLYKMEYAGGTWTMTPGYNSDGKCGLTRTAAAPPPVVDAAIPTADAAGVPGAVPSVPGASPGAVPGAGATAPVVGVPGSVAGAVPSGVVQPGGVPAGAMPPVSGAPQGAMGR